MESDKSLIGIKLKDKTQESFTSSFGNRYWAKWTGHMLSG